MSASAASHAQYLRIFFALVAAAWLLAAAVNVALDPYGLSGRVQFLAFPTVPVDYPDPRLSKLFAVERIRPGAIALGTSRTDHGIDVLFPGFAVNGKPAYNLGLDAADMSETLAYLKHAYAVAAVRRVVVGLDFFSFSNFGPPSTTQSDILATPDDPRETARSIKRVLLTLDWATLRKSLKALVYRHATPERDVQTGSRTDYAFEKRIGACGGPGELLLAGEAKTMRLTLESRAGEPPSRSRYRVSDDSLRAFRDLVRFARDNGMDLRLFISPTHAREMEGIRLLGDWDSFEHWKRDLVAILAQENNARGRDPPFRLWDFSGYNTITTERIPEVSDGGPAMHFFWDRSHYRRVVGDMVLARMFGRSDQARPVPTDFGILVSSANIDEHLQNIRRAGERYRIDSAFPYATLGELLRAHREHVFRPSCDAALF